MYQQRHQCGQPGVQTVVGQQGVLELILTYHVFCRHKSLSAMYLFLIFYNVKFCQRSYFKVISNFSNSLVRFNASDTKSFGCQECVQTVLSRNCKTSSVALDRLLSQTSEAPQKRKSTVHWQTHKKKTWMRMTVGSNSNKEIYIAVVPKCCSGTVWK